MWLHSYPSVTTWITYFEAAPAWSGARLLVPLLLHKPQVCVRGAHRHGALALLPPCSVQNVGAELWVRLLGPDRCGVCSQLEALPPRVWQVTFDSLWGKRESGKFCNEKLCSTAGVGGIVPNSGLVA